ncbi:Receptor-like protein 14 [Cardamine amara subsp. amara]|uniref:Receptor-like protein 14 n=1 Tax=Cardamine amara subsp. amara TaxID=228776 RepID=A0ABD1BG13_CARAN
MLSTPQVCHMIWVMLLLGQLHGYKSCIQKERKALLELKTYLLSISEEEVADDVLPTWTNDTKSNCCRWEGLKCNQTSGRIIEFSIGETHFKESSLFNLSLMHPFEELRSLNLSWDGSYLFNGLFDDVEGYESLRRLRKLEILDLSYNAFSNSIFPFLNAATSITTLSLRSNYMGGPLPIKELKNLTNLELLDLSGSGYNGSIPELKNLKNLEVLGLAWNHLGDLGPIEVFCEMKNLRELYLDGNIFLGQLPLCLGSLKNLRVLDLSSNQFTGNMPSSFSSLESLEYLSLADNDFTGFFLLDPLANLTKLKVFKLSSTSDMVQIDTEGTWQPKFQLRVAALPFCSLEKIPNFFVYQKNLRLVDLSNNRLSGDIPTWLLGNNPELEFLDLKNNSFTIFQMHTLVHKLHKFQVLDISANDIGGVLPDNLGHMLPNLVHMNGSDKIMGFKEIFHLLWVR